MDTHTVLLERYIDYLLTESTPEAPVWNIENIRMGKRPGWNYIDGLMIKAVLELYAVRREQRYLDFADGFIGHYVREDGSILGYELENFNIDNIQGGKVLFTLFDLTGRTKYRKALEMLRAQLDRHPRTAAGNFWHKKIYPHQVWLDGLYMAQPFFIQYQTRYQDCTGYNDIYNQFANVVRLMRDQHSGLYYHGYDESKSQAWCDPLTGLSSSFWLRSLGWFAMAMVDVLEQADSRRCQGRYQELARNLKELISALLVYQNVDSGLWYQVVDKPELKGNYLETSGSAILAYSILKAVRLGILDQFHEAAARRAFEGICTCYLSEKNGRLNLGGICLVAGLGGEERRDGSAAYYLSEPVVENDAKGVGPFLLAYTELLRRSGSGA
ncbi:MAG: glycoside hydrolase family 88 protein [Spirochaetes bacterium]|nr:glycoside hydrolase family 88 protein [Spirochaetota bacterium]MBU0954348.1 glycoside hydrolase family 88 protein [Spirochaetota bacterium]